MPAIVGPVLIRTLADDSAAFFGDVFAISPKSTDFSGGGAGSFSTGDYSVVHSGISNTVLTDADVLDGIQGFNG
ncbi:MULTISPECIES: spore germination protein [Bacillus]|uniref:spore germination protein n=1 Tax=Bacillus TaxID=1386 RepID=UPI00040ECFDF|nr:MULTISPECIES: spore germination protein [Bacillus]QHZ45766.1 spore germination protein [Bacillus sp. NSP9.1]WFA04371.1 spore germination protein [Bacillus sp. HSf4]